MTDTPVWYTNIDTHIRYIQLKERKNKWLNAIIPNAPAKTANAATTANVTAPPAIAAINVPAANKVIFMTEHNPSHMENMPRLNRINGQIEGIKKMVEDGRYCPDIITQLRAVRSALKAVESNILKKHLQHCVAQSFTDEDKDKKIEELKMLFDRFDD